MDAKWTPGPWKCNRNDMSGGQYDVYGDNGRGKWVCETSGHNADANAHLIAAAPDLAFSLVEMVDMFRRHIDGKPGPDDAAARWDRARDALAKAGVTP
jgi:hypothetical protein